MCKIGNVIAGSTEKMNTGSEQTKLLSYYYEKVVVRFPKQTNPKVHLTRIINGFWNKNKIIFPF